MWKHDNLDEVQLGLLKKNILAIGGEIDPPNAIYVREALLRLTAAGSPEITINITSDGGEVDIGLAIFDMIR
ncbi:MAG: ATP-dependent Clp protease proteolytic subunit, partial [Patescibacteria group bacterium]